MVQLPDAASFHGDQGGLLERPRRRAEVHPEPEPVPVHLPQGAWGSGGEADGPARDLAGREWDTPAAVAVKLVSYQEVDVTRSARLANIRDILGFLSPQCSLPTDLSCSYVAHCCVSVTEVQGAAVVCDKGDAFINRQQTFVVGGKGATPANEHL